MNTIIKVALPAFLLLTACATHNSAFEPVQPSEEKGSVIYVYRASEYSSMVLAPAISINNADGVQANFGSLGHGEYKFMYLPPGKYEIQLESIEYYAPGNMLTIEVQPHSVNYLQLETSLEFESGTRYKPYERKMNLRKMESSIALDEIADCIDVDSKPVNKKSSAKTGPTAAIKEISDEEAGVQFSTDKTSDPFSRNK